MAFVPSAEKLNLCNQQPLLHLSGGIPPEYLSGLKTGARTPGFQTFNILKMLASESKAFEISDPKVALLDELTSSVKDDYEEMLQKLAKDRGYPNQATQIYLLCKFI